MFNQGQKHFSKKTLTLISATTIVAAFGFSGLVLPSEILACNYQPPEVVFDGVTYDSQNNTSTWTYTVSRESKGSKLSWIWQPCYDITTLKDIFVSAVPSPDKVGAYCFTLHYGVKWEVGRCFETGTFSVTIIGQPEVDDTGAIAVIKAGVRPHFDLIIPGPSCAEPPPPEPYCGDGNLDCEEECDDGENNGQECVPDYGSSCTYCSLDCQIIEVQGPFCGDGILDEPFEQCDDGNNINNDGCSATCTIEEEEEEEPVTIIAFKVVCENEEDLPNWGDGISGPNQITAVTALEYVTNSCDGCWLAEDWDFQWGIEAEKQAGDHIGPAPEGTGWSNFDSSTGSTTPAQVQIFDLEECTSQIWVRENLKQGYLPFTFPPGEPQDNISAEMYCHTDIYKYDNYDNISNPQLGETYYCIAFNVLVFEPEPYCGDGNLDEGEECDDGNNIDGDLCSSQCQLECEEITVTGYYGQYYNHIPDGSEFQGPITGLNPGDSPFNYPHWWAQEKLSFIQVDSDLTFGEGFFPVNEGLFADPYHFTVHWRALLTVTEGQEGVYGYTLTSDDDSWLYIDDELVEDLGGVHIPVTRNGSVDLTVGEHNFDLYFAERHTIRSHLYFAWADEGLEIKPWPPYCPQLPQPECTPDETQPCDTGLLGICAAGTQTCDSEGFWGECVQDNEPTDEICDDEIDNDCDGATDCDDSDCSEDPACQGLPQPECTPDETQACETGLLGICAAGTQTCDSEGFWGECVQDNEPTDEICDDELDNDCDGYVDDDDEDCQEPTPPVVSLGGGGISFQSFMILNESVHANTTENCEVIITWTTNYFSTSQVIYASEGESHTLDLSDNTGTPPKYGYAYTTQEYHTSPKVTGHTVTISDLTPLTTYYYRAVSRSSPPAVSRQHSFTTTSCSALEEKKEEEEVEEKVEEKIEEEIFPTPVGEAPEKEEAPEEKEEPIEEEIVEEEIIKEEMVEEKPISLLASLLAAIKFPSCLPWWLILIFTLYPLIKGITALQKSKKEIFLKKDFQKQGIIWLICCLIPIILAISLFLLKYFCVPIWIFLILILATILAWGFVPTSNKDKSSWAVNQQI